MFASLDLPAEDPILGLIAAFRNDPSAEKVDLGVGVYRDERSVTTVLDTVKAAEQRLVNEQDSKAYLGPAGNERFNEAIAALVLGAKHAAIRDGRARTVQAPGGCGALRIGAELIHKANAAASLVVSDPTWANHIPLLSSAGLQIQRYPYYDVTTGGVQFERMLDSLNSQAAGTIVLLHGACHNPTGADLSQAQWHQLADVLSARRLVPFVDLAYQGLGDGLDEDAAGARILSEKLPEVLIAVSCSKSFGLYRERVGALIVVAEGSRDATAAAANLGKIARGIYSMPPDHGAAIVARILEDAKFAAQWRKELSKMRERIGGLRNALTEALTLACPGREFAHITRQRGMFSMLDVAPESVERLRKDKHIYMAGDGRINISGLREQRIDYVAWAVAEELNNQRSKRAVAG
ncbi:aromatic amino acid transaminase [Steroidobacter sp.]|uniref:amino acid aminotransferase n=1 Tax=Steroidobacter sp. TaxID=1978227 RepID=UPI001A3B5993|nr:amino acid aminotransferase [Steroidobacter sp.]MBL8266118.1 aspartate/tyrosine/aromatic aminotransferase [Steroidobacter sp.]